MGAAFILAILIGGNPWISGSEKRMERGLDRIIIFFSALATLVLVFKSQPSSAGAGLVIAAWMLAPYLVFWRHRVSTKEDGRFEALFLPMIAAAGPLFTIDVLFIHPDPQGGIALFMLPGLQFVAFAVGKAFSQSK